jgi:imidazole glycerol phosphate synthase subunit HisF
MIKRLGAAIVLDSSLVVNAYKFTEHLPVGILKFTVQRLQQLEIDEIIILNSTHSDSPDSDFEKLYGEFDSWHISTPIAYGGGITTKKQATNIIKGGADRVVVSAKALLLGSNFSEISEVLGEQSLILHLPIIEDGPDLLVRNLEDTPLEVLVNKIPENWGGEILISSIAHDGSHFPDWNLIKRFLLNHGKNRRLILCSGFCSESDILEGLKFREVQSVAIGNYLHRTELSVPLLKDQLARSVQVR